MASDNNLVLREVSAESHRLVFDGVGYDSGELPSVAVKYVEAGGRGNLIKAAAFLVSEIARLDRNEILARGEDVIDLSMRTEISIEDGGGGGGDREEGIACEAYYEDVRRREEAVARLIDAGIDNGLLREVVGSFGLNLGESGMKIEEAVRLAVLEWDL